MTDLDRLDALAAAATPGPWVQSMFVDGREYEHMSKPWKDARQAEEVRMVRSGSAKGQHVALAQDPWNAEADAAFIAACDPATIRDLVAAVRERDALREAAERVIREYDKTNLTHDTMYEDVATEIDWLRIALDPQHPMYGQVESEARIRAELRALDSEPAAPPAPDRAAGLREELVRLAGELDRNADCDGPV